MNKNSNNKKIKYQYIRIRDEDYNYLLEDIENIILPNDKRPYVTIIFKSGEIWIFSEPYFFNIQYIDEDKKEKKILNKSEIKTFKKIMKKNKKKLLKMTLKEFLNFFDLSNLGGFQIYIDENAEQHYKNTFIRHYTFKDFLYANKIDYDSDRHIVKLESGDIKIIDWDPKFEFYIVFIWDEEKEMYKSYNRCFFEKEDAKNFIKEI